MITTAKARSVKKMMEGTASCTAVTDPILQELCYALADLGYVLDNQAGGLIWKHEEWRLYFSKGTGQFHCYWCGYGHCAVFCSLLDFRDADHIILWQEEQKSMTLTEPPIVRLGTPGNW